MAAIITTPANVAEVLRRIRKPTGSDPALAQTPVERAFLSLLPLAAFVSGRGLMTIIGGQVATDTYYLLVLVGLGVLVFLPGLYPVFGIAILAYVLYEILVWTLFDFFVLLRFQDLQGVRTTARSFIWAAYGYVIVLIAYGLYFWSSGGIVDASEKALPSGLAGVYYSAITIATVGYGDYYPAHARPIVQLVAASEPFAGLLILGLYLSVLASTQAAVAQKTFAEHRD